jgi:glycosyltransferase involved in cell wall biosynthesis
MNNLIPRVLHISSRGDYGGGPEHIFRLCEGMLKNSIYISLFVAIPRETPYWNRFVELLGEDNCLEIPRRKFSLKSLSDLMCFSRKNRINIVHSHGKGASTLARPLVYFFQKKYINVHTAHGIHVSQYGIFALFLYKLYENFTSKLSTSHIIFVSESEKNKAKSIGLWKSCDNSIILNGVRSVDNCININNQEHARWISNRRKELGLPQNSFLVISIARFSKEKNMVAALKIAEKLPQMTFVWIGDGPEQIKISKEISDKEIENIIITGFQNDVSSYLSISDAYLSTSFGEGLPLTMLEAMAHGLPIVGSDVVGNSDILSLSNYLFNFPLENLNDAIHILERLSTDVVMRENAKKASLYLQQSRFSIESMIKKTEFLYENILRLRD